MARLQILELPTEHHGDDMVTPFVLVVDQATEATAESLHRAATGADLSSRIGARSILCFDEAVEIPANDPSSGTEEIEVSEDAFKEMATAVRCALGIDITEGQPDVGGWLLAACRELEKSEAARVKLRDERTEARQWARHGYEIGQRHCGWTDHGVAPAWLTEGWPPHIDSCEHLKHAAEYDEALTRIRNLPEHPDIMDARHPEPNGYLHGYKVAIHDAKRATRNDRAQAAEAGA